VFFFNKINLIMLSGEQDYDTGMVGQNGDKRELSPLKYQIIVQTAVKALQKHP